MWNWIILQLCKKASKRRPKLPRMINHNKKKHGDGAVSMGFSTMTDVLGYKSITGALINLLYITYFLWRSLKTNLWILENELYEGSCTFLHRTSVFFKHFDLYSDCKAFRLSLFSLHDAQRMCSVSLYVIRRNALSNCFLFSSKHFFFVAIPVLFIFVFSYEFVGFIRGNTETCFTLFISVETLFLWSPSRYSWFELGKTSKYHPVNTDTFLKVNHLSIYTC